MAENNADDHRPVWAKWLAAALRFVAAPTRVAALLAALVVLVFLGMALFGSYDARSFFTEVLDALAWPAVVFLLVCLFYEPLCELIGRVKSVEAGPVRVELRDAFQDLEDQTSPLFGEAVAESRDLKLDAMFLELGPSASPRQAILDAWLVVERSLRDLVWAKTRTQPPRTFRGLGTRIGEEDLLPERLSAAVDTLRRIYRTVRRASDADVSQEQADYYHRCVSLVVSAVNSEIQKARESQTG